MAKLVPDTEARDDVENFVHCKDHATLRAQAAAGEEGLTATVNNQKVVLKFGVHFFLSSTEAIAARAL